MQVYIGIDWSEKKHDVVIMNEEGAALVRMTIEHDLAGFYKLDQACRKLELQPEACRIGLETAHNLVIDYLWSQGYGQVYVIPPNVVKSNRGRFVQSGARDDQADAMLIAEILRTDRGRLQPWFPDSALTQQMRAKVSLGLHLTQSQIRLSNRLRAVLMRYYPAAVHVFSKLSTQIAPQFIIAYPTPQAARRLSYAQFEAFALDRGYPNRNNLLRCYDRLQAPYPQANPETSAALQAEAPLLAQFLSETICARLDVLRELKGLFRQHPDYPIFKSLPGTGDLLAPALLVKFGDDRRRFPSAKSVQALAGTCPVTRISGKRRTTHFRRSCDRQWRYLAQHWARSLVVTSPSPIAQAYYRSIRPHCHSTSHAYRCVANRWLAIAWKLWHSRQPYVEAYHFQQRSLRAKPRI